MNGAVRSATLRATRPTGRREFQALDLLQVVVLALIQGITEFLPISSSAHLILPAALTDWPDQGLAFDIAVHVGTLVAVIAYLRGELAALAGGAWRLVTRGQMDAQGRLLLQVAVATLPIVVVGYLGKDWVASSARDLWIIAATSIVFGIVLWLADRGGDAATRGELDLGWRDALVIGLAQVLSIVPGTSRSGITMTAGLFLGLTRAATARFSFLLSIPTILGAGLLATLDLMETPGPIPVADLLLGALLAGVAAYFCMSFFVRLIERTRMTPYVIYRVAFGVLLLAFGAWPEAFS